MEEEVASGVRGGVSLNYFNRAKKNFRHLNLIVKMSAFVATHLKRSDLRAFEYHTHTEHVKEASVIIVELSKSDLNAFLKNKRINYDYSKVSLEQRCDQEIRVFITPYACYARAATYISFFYVYYMLVIFSLSSSPSCICCSYF